MKPHRSTQSSGPAVPNNDSVQLSMATATTKPLHRPRRIQPAIEAEIVAPPQVAETAGSPGPVQRAQRLISEAAHDIRTPLTTVRESVRLVNQGELSDINAQQSECLDVAVNQCDQVAEILDDLLTADRLLAGTPRILRKKTKLADISRAVDQVHSRSLSHPIELLWDLDSVSNHQIFADAGLLCRLLVNLIDNASAASTDDRPILIRVTPAHGDDSVRWSVIDSGPGISPADLQRITGRHASGTGGSGLGLNICRTIAALHFSDLHITSAIRLGTEVSFETPVAGPRAVAEAWIRWRTSYVGGTADQTS